MNGTNQVINNNFFYKMAHRFGTHKIGQMIGLLAILSSVNIGHALVPLTGIAKIATGNGHTCAVTTSGNVKCWGLNFYGQLGDNSNTNGYS